ncbi:hypothetical protein ACFLU3_06210, partial [Chloroflexota bacterium]
MNTHIDQKSSDEFKQRLAEDPISFLDYPAEVVFSLEPAAKDSISMVSRLADQNLVSTIDSFNDLIRLCYNQETFKGYPL